ncbi:MAG: hypothetical protein ACOYBJ_02795 [Patescibacteria group bacterium]|jgi:hypothetical protein
MYAWLIGQRERIAGIVAGSTVLAPVVALAQTRPKTTGGDGLDGQLTRPTAIPLRWGDFDSVIQSVFTIVITVAGIVFILLFLAGGVMYLASAGNEDSAKKATKLMMDAVIGLVLILIAWAVGTYVLRLLGLTTDGSVSLTPEQLQKSKSGDIIN